MKKVFLSLATIAFVAAGSLTVTSCGSDDSTPGGGGGEQPITSNGKMTYNNEDFALDTAVSQIYAQTNAQGQNVAIAYRYPINNGQDTIRVTRWNIISHNGEDAQTSENYHQISIYVPVDGNSIVKPNAAQTVYFAGAGVYAGSVDTPLDLGQLSAFDINFNNFVDTGDDAATINYTTSLTGANGTVTTEYDGKLNGTFAFIPSAAPKGKNVKFSKGEKINLNNLTLSKDAILVK